MDALNKELLKPKYITPIVITALVFLWAYIVSPFTTYGDNWATYPVLFAALVLIAWHLFLVIKPGAISRLALVVYAAIHGFIFFVIFMLSLAVITKDSL